MKLERWRKQVSRYLPGESDCSTCRFARIEGSRDSPGGGDCQGYDQTGCDQSLLSEAYTLCEPAGMLLEGMMIKMAESGSGCPWQEVKTEDISNPIARKVLDDAEILERFLGDKP